MHSLSTSKGEYEQGDPSIDARVTRVLGLLGYINI